VLGCILVVLIAGRIALPSILLKMVNRELARIHGYKGHVDGLDVSLFRGAYTLKNIYLDKTSGKVPVHFFSAQTMDLSVEWKALLHRRLVGKIVVNNPILNFVSGPTKATSQTGIDSSWTIVIGKLMPLKINRFEIIGGEIHYRDFTTKPKVDLYASQVHIIAANLSNVNREQVELPSTATGTATVYGGKAQLYLKINAMAPLPTFEARAEMLGLDITNLNNFLEAYGNFDVKQGTISIYTEAAARDGAIKGYVKPIIKDLKVVDWKEDKAKPLKIAWEAIIGAAAWVFKNHRKDQLATKADFEGNIRDPKVNVWDIIGQTLRNAFIQALYPSLENSVHLNSVPASSGQKPTELSKQYQKSKSGS